ncbi:MAG: thiamine pyrophosphate-dependent enzyme [Bacteroidia bacterium]|nr:thiamine pyrophosphate-dependent enzyme [Bacteroidia bacterium]
MQQSVTAPPQVLTLSPEEVIADYRLAYQSRQASLIGRREVLTGKAKFGIFGDGKEVAQLAMAKAFRPGDIRSGYYRDQTFALAAGFLTIEQFFAQLYANPDVTAEPASAGRQMNGHFGSRMLDGQGNYLNLTEAKHSVADISPTAGQMPRLVGLAQASKLYRNVPELAHLTHFSYRGNEIAWGTIGDASTSEGLFWEAINAVGVLQVPLLMSVWDDGYGISVPIKYQTTKASISAALAGFQATATSPGYDIYVVPGWDYLALIDTYQRAAYKVRTAHTPALVHVVELTQPQGHSTSGSHERYKSKERLEWERQHDCLTVLRQLILDQGLATDTELQAYEKEDKRMVGDARKSAWDAFFLPIQTELAVVTGHLKALEAETGVAALATLAEELGKTLDPIRRDVLSAARKALLLTLGHGSSQARQALSTWLRDQEALNAERYNSHLYSESDQSPLRVTSVPPQYAPDAPLVDGRELLQAYFDGLLGRDPRVLAFGEDVGFLGDVNQAFAGLQAKYGEHRVSDTGIREATIVGQGIGLALRGLRPIAEIQYLDYLLYALQILSDDLSTLRYRTKGGQKAPLIVRTRGHRLEGIWHSGSPMGVIVNAFRGMHVCVPRNMTQAAGLYNTLFQGDDPALVIEVLNGYRLKEPMPSNLAEMRVPLGVPEVLRQGRDITVVTYGPNCRLALDAAEALATVGVELEVIDVQTLLPFDREGVIVRSLEGTSRVIFLDEDVPGGATAYMLQQVLEVQGGYRYLDEAPQTLTAKAHRPAYGSDGDYFSKPTVEQLIEVALRLMHASNPAQFPALR